MRKMILFSVIILTVCVSSTAFGYHYAISCISYGSNISYGGYPGYYDILEEPRKPIFDSDYEKEKFISEAKQYLEDLNTYVKNTDYDSKAISEQRARAEREIITFTKTLKRYIEHGI